jgi:hypothetical protein
MAGLVLVDAVEVGGNRQVGRGRLVDRLHHGIGMGPDAQGTEQAVDVQQFRPQDLRQFAARETPRNLHLEQPVLGVHISQRPVHVAFVGGLDMRDAALVIAHVDRRLQAGQGELAVALRLFAVNVPGQSGGGQHQQEQQPHEGPRDELFHGCMSPDGTGPVVVVAS